MKKDTYKVKTADNIEKAILIAVEIQTQSREQTDDYLAELEFLTITAGAEVVKQFVQRLAAPNPKTYVGTGKLEEIAAFIEKKEIETAIFDPPWNDKNQLRIHPRRLAFLDPAIRRARVDALSGAAL